MISYFHDIIDMISWKYDIKLWYHKSKLWNQGYQGSRWQPPTGYLRLVRHPARWSVFRVVTTRVYSASQHKPWIESWISAIILHNVLVTGPVHSSGQVYQGRNWKHFFLVGTCIMIPCLTHVTPHDVQTEILCLKLYLPRVAFCRAEMEGADLHWECSDCCFVGIQGTQLDSWRLVWFFAQGSEFASAVWTLDFSWFVKWVWIRVHTIWTGSSSFGAACFQVAESGFPLEKTMAKHFGHGVTP